MSLVSAEILAEIRVVCGDLADQFNSTADLKLPYELENTLLFLTSQNIFYWNVRESGALPHSSGVITVPSNMGKVLQIIDSNNNESYYIATYEEFYMKKRNPVREITYSSSTPVPYLITTSTTTGEEQIELGTFENTDADREFYITYSEYTNLITPWIPERLRPFIVSFTAANFLTKIDSPDANLIQAHVGIARSSLIQEKDFSRNRAVNRFQSNMAISGNRKITLGDINL